MSAAGQLARVPHPSSTAPAPRAALSPIFKQPLQGKWEIPPLSAAGADASGGSSIVLGRCPARLRPRSGSAARDGEQGTGSPCYYVYWRKKEMLNLLQQPPVPLGTWIRSRSPRAGGIK